MNEQEDLNMQWDPGDWDPGELFDFIKAKSPKSKPNGSKPRGNATVTSLVKSKHDEADDYVNGLPPVESPTKMVTSVQHVGLGNRQASLYLSRATPLRTPGPGQTPPVTVPPTPAPGKANDAPRVGSKKRSSIQMYDDMYRQFTFTGYDIMKDETPKTPIPEGPDKLKEEYSSLYKEACKQMGITPVKYLADRLTQSEVIMNSHGLGPDGARAVAIALVKNNKIQNLSLEDNWIAEEGAIYVAEMLTANFTITELNLSENRMGSEGAIAVCKVLCFENEHIRMLDLSGNQITDDAMQTVAQVLKSNIYLRELRLSHNEIGEDGAILLSQALKLNDTLEALDLSWNHIRGKGAWAIGVGMASNSGIEELNLSWNGFGNEGAQSMGKALIVNKTLSVLDMSSNRLHPDAVAMLMKGVKENQGIQKLKISTNPITPKIALLILQVIHKSSLLNELREIDMWDIVVDTEFQSLLKEVQEHRPEFSCKHGPVMGKYDISAYARDAALGTTDPLEILFSFMGREGMRVIDLLKRFDADGSMSVSRDEFMNGLISVNAPLTRGQLDELMDKLDEDGDGEIDLNELTMGAQKYKRKQLKKKLHMAEVAAAAKKAAKEKQQQENVDFGIT